jgi:hypothetical protein
MKLNREQEALATYRRPLTLAETNCPEFQGPRIEELKQKQFSLV